MNYIRHLLILVVAIAYLFQSYNIYAQDFSAGINTETPNPNTVLHLVSPNGDQGLLIPKLTTLQRTAMITSLGTADEGIMVYDEEEQRFYFWNGTVWVFINSGISGAISAVTSDATLLGDGAATLLSVNTGTGPNQIVQLDGLSNLPAVDGSALTNVTAVGFSSNLTGDVGGPQNATVVNSVGGQTAANVATAAGIVNGAPALDVDATDDFDENSTPLGVFTGITISDNTALTNALQELETAVEGFTAVNVDGATITGDGNATPLAVGTLAAAQVTGLSAVATTGNFGDLLTIPAGLADGDDVGLAAVNVDGTTITGDGDVTALAVGNVPAASVTGLSAVATTGNFGDLLTIPAGLADGDDVGLTAVTSADITDDEIVNLDINSGADIAASKLQATVMVEGENISLLNNDVGYLTAIAELDPVWTTDRTTLGTLGTINDPGNLIEWTRLRGVPAGFSDGVDDGLTAVTSADITNGEIVDADINAAAAIAWTKINKTGANVSELANDAGYLTTFAELDPVWTADRTTLGTVGTINDPGNLIEWTRLRGIPVGFSDGVDDGLTAVTSADITNNEILDVDINAAAGIAATKLQTTVMLEGENVSLLVNDAGYLTAFTELDPVWTGDRTTLGTVGTINDAGNLIEWTRLKGIPVGFADGVDDGLTTVTSADITNGEIQDADINAAAGIAATKLQATVMVEGENVSLLTNDAGFLTAFTELDPVWTADRTTLAATGTINDPGNLIDWTRLKSVPAAFADGTDDGLWTDNAPNISYTAGNVGIGIVPTSAILEVATSTADPIARFDKASASTGPGILIDMNNAITTGRPAIVINDALVPIQIPGVPSSDGKILISDGSGNMTFQDGFGRRFETTNYLAVNSGGAGSIATGATNNIIVGGTAAQALTTGDNNIAIGSLALIGVTTGTGNIGIGVGSGGGTLTTGTGNVLIGEGSIVSGGNPATSNNVAIGPGTNVQNNSSVAIGNISQAIVPRSIAIGNGAGVTASGQDGVAIGTASSVIAQNSIAIGNTAAGNGDNGISIGTDSDAAIDAISIGRLSQTVSQNAIAIGQNANVNALNSIGIGANTAIIGDNSVAMGENANVNFAAGALALGHNANVTANGAMAVGEGAIASEGLAVAIGSGALADKVNTVTIGNRTATRLNLEVTGAQYVGVRTLTGLGIVETVRTDDYIVYFEPGTTGDIELPAASAENVGRKLIFCTDGTGTDVTLRTAGNDLTLYYDDRTDNSIIIRRNETPGNGAVMYISLVLVAPDVWMVMNFEGLPF